MSDSYEKIIDRIADKIINLNQDECEKLYALIDKLKDETMAAFQGYDNHIYKLEIWAYGRVVDEFSDKDICALQYWFNLNWIKAYEAGLCFTYAYRDGELMDSYELEWLGLR